MNEISPKDDYKDLHSRSCIAGSSVALLGGAGITFLILIVTTLLILAIVINMYVVPPESPSVPPSNYLGPRIDID
jgi:hypothetical protein